MIRPNDGFVLCTAVESEDIITESGIAYTEVFDARIRVASVVSDPSGKFKDGVKVIIPMGFATECSFRRIKYVFVKPENIVGYED